MLEPLGISVPSSVPQSKHVVQSQSWRESCTLVHHWCHAEMLSRGVPVHLQLQNKTTRMKKEYNDSKKKRKKKEYKHRKRLVWSITTQEESAWTERGCRSTSARNCGNLTTMLQTISLQLKINSYWFVLCLAKYAKLTNLILVGSHQIFVSENFSVLVSILLDREA